MIKNYLKVAFRNLQKNKVYSLINIGGLGIGFGCAILILLFIKNEMSFDSTYKNGRYMYSLLTKVRQNNGDAEFTTKVPAAMATELKDALPEIDQLTYGKWGDAILTYKDKVFNEHILFASPDVIRMFDIELGHHSSELLRNPNEIILSEHTAKKYFGNESPIGKELRFETRKGAKQFFVTGLAKSLPQNSSLQYFDCLVHYSNHDEYSISGNNWATVNGEIVLQLKKSADLNKFQKRLQSVLNQYHEPLIAYWKQQGDELKHNATTSYQFELRPISDIYFDKRNDGLLLQQGDSDKLNILSGIAVIILIIACFNFMMLSLALTAKRTKEIGVRKALGAGQTQLLKQHFGESVLFCTISSLIGLFLAYIILPFFNQMMASSLSFKHLFDNTFMFYLIGLLALVSLMVGGYPAFFIARLKVVEILKSKFNFRAGSKNLSTQTMIVLQFGISVLLISVIIGISSQMKYVLSKDLAFNPKEIINIRTRTGFFTEQDSLLIDRFRTEAATNPNVLNVSGIGQFSLKKFTYRDEDKQAIIIPADDEFINTLEIKLSEGRNFTKGSSRDRSSGIIVNETFAHQMGWKDKAIGTDMKSVSDSSLQKLEVIGVVKDFHLLSLKKKIFPIIIVYRNDLDGILVKLNTKNKIANMDFLQSAWNKVSHGKPYEFQFLDKALQSEYESDLRQQAIIFYASVISITLSCLGLLGIFILSLANRTKEIAIRKLLGASSFANTSILLKSVFKLMILANCIALPAAYVIISKWLQNYAYRLEPRWWMFALAGISTIVIALLTVGYQAMKAALANPVKSLRTE